MSLTGISQMNASESSRDGVIQGGDINLGDVHINWSDSMDSGYIFMFNDRQPQF